VGKAGEVECPHGLTYVGGIMECGMVAKVCPATSHLHIKEETCYHEYEFVRAGTAYKKWPAHRLPELQNPLEKSDLHLKRLHFVKTAPELHHPFPTTVAPPLPPLQDNKHNVLVHNDNLTAREKAGELEEWNFVVAGRLRRPPPPPPPHVEPTHLPPGYPDIIRVNQVYCLHRKPTDLKYEFEGPAFFGQSVMFKVFIVTSLVLAAVLLVFVWRRQQRTISGRQVSIKRVPRGELELLE